MNTLGALQTKWQHAKARNSTLAMKELATLGLDHDTEEAKEALLDYRDIARSDYSDAEEYQEARDEAWETFIECLESLTGDRK